MSQTFLFSEEKTIKKGLDDFKIFLANEELKNLENEFYWRLAFWSQINKIFPQITFFEKDGRLDSGYLSHNWHSFPAKFYPQLVRSLMNICKVKKGSIIFDPYAGCGTTLVESKLMGFDATGLDISKLAVMITKVKTNLDIDLNLLNKNLYLIISKSESDLVNEKNNFYATDFERYWYSEGNLKQLKILKKNLDSVKEQDIKDFFLVALSSILRRIANTKSGQIEVRHQVRGKVLDVLSLFKKKVKSMEGDILNYREYSPRRKSKTDIKFANASESKIKEESVDFIITSPPYGNGLDYSKIHKLSIALIFGEDELEFFKNSQTGTLYSQGFESLVVPFSKRGQEIVEVLSKEVSLNRAKAMSKYYWDMFSSIKNMFQALKKEGNCVIIIGGTKIRGLEIDNSQVLLEIAEHIGFKRERILNWEYDKTRRSGLEHKIKGEAILVLKK